MSEELETGLPNALDPMEPALLIHNLVGLRQLLDIERGSNWQGRCHFLNQAIRTVQHLSAPDAGKAEPVAWLIQWMMPDNQAQGRPFRTRVQLSDVVEPWLHELSPTKTPLYAHPQPPQPSPGVEEAVERFAELARLADAATQGEWTVSEAGGKAALIYAPHPEVGKVAVCRMDWSRGPFVAAANAAFIAAANPVTVKALLAALFHQTSARVEAEEERDRLRDKVEGLTADLQMAVQTAYNRGAVEWTRLNYPQWFAWCESSATQPKDTDHE